MAANLEFFKAFIDGSDSSEWSDVWILGKRLRKFSLWHCLLLRAAESPLVGHGDVGMRDIQNAIAICRLQFGQSKIRRPKLMPAFIAIRATLTALASVFRFWRKVPQGTLPPYHEALKRAMEAFVSYTGDYFAKPDLCIHTPPSPGTPQTPRGRLPQEIEHVADLMAYPGLGISEARAWNMPVSMANFYRPIAWRFRGVDCDFITDAEERWCEENLSDEYRHAPTGNN